MLDTRRSAIAAAATALAAIAIAVAVAGRGCGDRAASPASTVRALVTAARAGDREQVFELLGPATRARLERAAARASELDGGRPHRAIDLLEVAAPTADLSAMVVRQREDGRTFVDLVDHRGERTAIEVVRVDGAWRVELTGATGAP